MASLTSDKEYIQLALDEAKKALGRTSPNPCVGAVIVKKGRIVATGYHERAGAPHAEIHALERAGEEAAGATLYVTLEPCNHTGRTPPCSHAVVRSGISRVVIGMLDPNPLVSGAGKKYLLDHGVEVVDGVLEKECRQINESFIKYITTGLPLVALKAGVSLDGRLNYKRGESGWITGQQSAVKVHQLRNYYDAILVGRTTVAIDNPSLTTRLSDGSGRDPVRVILDSHLSLPDTAKIFHQQSESFTWLFCNAKVDDGRIRQIEAKGARVTVVHSDKHDHLDLKEVLQCLAQEDLTSLLVEGGARIHGSFLKSTLADKAYLFYAPIFAGSGGESLISNLQINAKREAVSLTDVLYTQFGEDMLVEGKINYPISGLERSDT
ncbi:MAG: bifunctional diaminohydroxyphosphoribosylaminopyrimidine deaminase/5-amino-6-(5-phosphoribosylamino)uracil reductase RibD [Desulfocapsaceae bacterium]|nr:bifunctional diaminohydroxyphosphoribosylaminopyrimidine deaminase/5-amino-6-(5-phosphoribosylamino)uracil reductase RibD [Desulfocapsaceae bacterium]